MRLNLLPPQQKEKLEMEKNFRLFFILETIFLGSFLVFFLILLLIKIHLALIIEEQKILYDFQQKEFSRFKTLEKELISINSTLSKVDSFYKDEFLLTNFLKRISEILPRDIYLTSFSFEREQKRVVISGFSPTIEKLLELKSVLESQEDFKEITFPEDLWLKTNNINFTVSFKLKL